MFFVVEPARVAPRNWPMVPNFLMWLTCHVVPWQCWLNFVAAKMKGTKRQRKDHTRVSIVSIHTHAELYYLLRVTRGVLEHICTLATDITENIGKTNIFFFSVNHFHVWKSQCTILILLDDHFFVGLSLWLTIDRPISWYWTYFVVSKKDTSSLMAANKKMLVWWCLSLFCSRYDIDSYT